MKARVELKNEIERDTASRFSAEQYVSHGYILHFHRNIEIYGFVMQNPLALNVCMR